MRNIIAILLFITLMACNGDQGNAMERFIFQLQKVDIEQWKQVPFDIGVLDWEDASPTAEDIRYLQSQGKKVVSYLSIGEAEEYRDYWKPEWKTHPPAFLEQENPDWPGNYKVRYWDSTWQQVIFDKLDAIVAAGYDGVYLDIVDGYYYFEEKGRKQAAEEMIQFVSAMAKRAKAVNPQFLIIPQNAVDLVENDRYRAVIDGLGKESTWYVDNRPATAEELAWSLKFLDQIVAEGKFILAIDYPTELTKQCDFMKKARERGFMPFVSNRPLDKVEFPRCT